MRTMVSPASRLTLCDVVCLCRTQLTYSPAIGMLASTLGMTPCLTLEVRDSGRFSDTVIGRVTIPVAPLLSCPMAVLERSLALTPPSGKGEAGTVWARLAFFPDGATADATTAAVPSTASGAASGTTSGTAGGGSAALGPSAPITAAVTTGSAASAVDTSELQRKLADPAFGTKETK